ncbi:MAG: hypothetical protein A2V62_03055 [Nitrospirae bacterium RBG_19FT_COMBO_58_9]|nr:MAG: hypothetical protein A2V62_03055 [Nitrospirae bacterium RBG_19FT_COMBO_58_9]
MNFKRTVSVGVVAVGLMCSGEYAQAAESSQSAPGSPYAGAFGGVIDLSVPGGVRNMNSTSGTKAETAKVQPAVAKESAPAAASATSAPSTSGAAGAAGTAAK